MDLKQFEALLIPSARDIEDRSLRYVSAPQDHDLALTTAWPFVCRALTGRFPWEMAVAIQSQARSR